MSNFLIVTNQKPSDNFFMRLFYGEQTSTYKPFFPIWYNIKAEDYGKADKK